MLNNFPEVAELVLNPGGLTLESALLISHSSWPRWVLHYFPSKNFDTSVSYHLEWGLGTRVIAFMIPNNLILLLQEHVCQFCSLKDPGTRHMETICSLREGSNSSISCSKHFLVGFPCGLVGKGSACNAGDLGSVPMLGRSPGEGKAYPLQYAVLENSMDCIVLGVENSWTWLSDFHFHFLIVLQILEKQEKGSRGPCPSCPPVSTLLRWSFGIWASYPKERLVD